MAPFPLDSDDLFISCQFGDGILIVRKLSQPDSPQFLPIPKVIKTIDPQKDEELKVFDTVIYGSKLKQLAAHLHNSPGNKNAWVNRQGYMYVDVPHFGNYHRLNDLFDWSKYGVVVPQFLNIWNRHKHIKDEIVVDLIEKDKALENCRSQMVKMVEELAVHRKIIEEKDKEIKRMEGQMNFLVSILEGRFRGKSNKCANDHEDSGSFSGDIHDQHQSDNDNNYGEELND